jgi:hypothetical protein
MFGEAYSFMTVHDIFKDISCCFSVLNLKMTDLLKEVEELLLKLSPLEPMTKHNSNDFNTFHLETPSWDICSSSERYAPPFIEPE